jgi:hypothetical protein
MLYFTEKLTSRKEAAMAEQSGQNQPTQSGKRVLFNILAFMGGLIVLLLLIKYLLKL